MKKVKKLVAMAVALAIISSFYVKDVKAVENLNNKLATVSTIDINDGSIQKRVTIKNITSIDIPVNSISIKYFMTSEGDYNFDGGFYDLKGIKSRDLKLTFEKANDDKKQEAYDSEVLISNKSNKILKPNEEISFSFNIWNWAGLDSKNDFSNNDNIAIYKNDGTDNKLIQGEEPLEKGTRIGTIQGASHKSPYEGQLVSKITGIVTSVSSNGFYMQDKYGDDLTETSDAIFIFTKSKPTVEIGDYLKVDGKVEEFAYKGELSKTEIVEPNIEALSKNNQLPKAVVIGKSGIKEIDKVIDNDGLSKFDPEDDGIDFYEALEGMRVSIENPTVTGFTEKFNELTVVSNNVKDEDKTIAGGVNISSDDYNPERVTVKVNNYGSIVKENIAVGDSFNGNITGIMDYSYGNFKLNQSEELPQYVNSSFKREETTLVSSGSDLTIATFNVENFIQNPSSSTDIQRLKVTAKSIVENLKTPDILSLEEVQDSNGNKNDGVVDSEATLKLLVNEINTLAGIRYSYTYVTPESGKDGGEPGGNIRNVFLYREDKGVKLFNKNPGGAVEGVSLIGEGEKVDLSKNPARIDPTNEAFNNSRKPLVGEFVYKGNKIFVVSNHLNSKGGDSKLFGASQPVVLSSEVQRMKQAKIIRSFTEELYNKNPNANIVVLGDLNDFEFSNPINEIKGNILSNLIEKVDKKERYTYNFEGNSQVLDHIITSNNLYKNAEVDIVHINADFTSSKIKTSDHDPVIAKLKLTDKGDIPVGPTDPTDPVDPPKPGDTSKPKVNDLIITEVYGAGGNTGSVFGRDYIEIYNNSDKELDLTGLKIIYSSDKGNDSTDITPLNGTLKPGAVLVVLQDDNGKNIPVDLKENENLRVIDVKNEKEQIEMSGSSGRIRIVNEKDEAVINQISYSHDVKTSYTRLIDGSYTKAEITPGIYVKK